jgi:hypothetical protein
MPGDDSIVGSNGFENIRVLGHGECQVNCLYGYLNFRN